jgi:hypothetical protein
VVITVLGGFLLLFGLTSFLVRGKLFLSTAVIAIVFGKPLTLYACFWTDEKVSYLVPRCSSKLRSSVSRPKLTISESCISYLEIGKMNTRAIKPKTPFFG